MSETLKLAAAAVSIIVGVCGLLGLIVRFVLLPYLREHLEKPIREAHHAVTVNHHSSGDPTIPDRIDTLTKSVSGLTTEVRGITSWKNEHNRLTDAVLAQGRDHERRIGRLET